MESNLYPIFVGSMIQNHSSLSSVLTQHSTWLGQCDRKAGKQVESQFVSILLHTQIFQNILLNPINLT